MSSAELCEPDNRSEPLDDTADAAPDARLSPDGRRREWRLPSTERSVPSVRWGLRAFLADTWLADDDLEDLILAACEAATNAVDHAQSPTDPFFQVAAEIDDRGVTIVITDHGQWLQRSPTPHRGRGLAMMHALADTTVVTHSHGTTVTIRNPTPHSQPQRGE